ncbi:MAG: asparagine synthase (glutamine-hydrolyzing) [Lewinellaceae bacterium]|nr:asparagine synthase (glutamine-hydrolyzing) [Saprospiraceae bacterium]MCB9340971.1 asparagine synthase (glutamine-hydrolyzing) [Lewinellaceae bacterium]
MCGITGYWSHQPLQPTAKNTIYNMVETLHHRGPDGYGYHFDQEHGLAMGHARLSIIDLETGDQPLFNRDRSLALTVNGEFYDYKRIRTGLRLEGFHFSTKSDSEIALPLYEKFGLDFIGKLRGEFAFALFDQRRQRLLLVRDRFGIKPLFYHVGKNAVVYGSEIKSLFAHPAVPRAFSKEGVLHQMMHTMVPGTSAFEGVHAVLPGHFLIIEKTKGGFDVRQQKYWDMDFPHLNEHDSSILPDQHIENVKEALTDAVAFRLEADVPVGCYLSGGIDSCSMLGLASSMQQSPVQAFTISFDHAAYDESAIAREMANATGAEQEEIKLAADELYGDNFIKTAWHAERTFYNTLGVAKWCMSKRVNECNYRVVVTGEGSDELFGGYPAFKRDMFLHGMIGDAEKHIGAMDESNKLFKGAILSENQISHPALDAVCGFTPSWIQSWMQALAVARPLLHDDLLAELKDYDPIVAIANSFDASQLDKRHPLDKAQYTWIKTMLECQILNWGGDRVDMANSMESRPAFLDHHVADVAKAIPPSLRIRGNTEKWVLREAMKHILPEVLYKREKFAFMAPPAHTSDSKRQAIQELKNRFLNEDAIKKAGLFDPARLKAFLKGYQEDKDPVSLVRKDALINHLLVLHILNEQFVQVERKAMGSLVGEEAMA